MSVYSRAGLAVALLISAAALPAQPRLDGASLWQIVPADVPADILNLKAKDYVLKQKLLPIGLSTLTTDVSLKSGKFRLSAGTQLIRSGYERHIIYCDATRTGKKANGSRILCFKDQDANGFFDSWFTTLSDTGAIISIDPVQFTAKGTPMEPLEYRIERPEVFNQDLFVGIQRRNFFNIHSRESFMVVFGNAQYTQEISTPIQFKSGEMPFDMSILGAKFTAQTEKGGFMQVKVHATMPRQPFGVARTTTYRSF